MVLEILSRITTTDQIEFGLTGNVLPVANGPVQSNRKIQLVPVKPVEI